MKDRFRKYARWACAAALAAGISLSGTTGSVLAASPEDTLDRAWKAFNIGQYATTLRLVQPLASEGNPRAQVMLGRCYESGLGVEQNMEIAAQWYALAAEQNDVEAQLLLAYAYQSGIGVPQDGSQALQWMQRAADGGLPEAAYALSQYYAKGRFVEKNPQTAFEWALKAAQGGYGQAMLFVGACYEHGVGVNEDPAQSAQWYEKARSVGLEPDGRIFNEVREYTLEPDDRVNEIREYTIPADTQGSGW